MSVQYPGVGGRLGNLLTGRANEGRGTPVEVSPGQWRTPVHKPEEEGGGFSHYTEVNGEDLARYPDVNRKIRESAERRQEAKIEDVAGRREQESRRRFDVTAQAQALDSRRNYDLTRATLEANDANAERRHEEVMQQGRDALSVQKDGLQLQGTGMVLSAMAQAEQTRLAREKHGDDVRYQQAVLEQNAKRLNVERKMALLETAARMFAGSRG